MRASSQSRSRQTRLAILQTGLHITAITMRGSARGWLTLDEISLVVASATERRLVKGTDVRPEPERSVEVCQLGEIATQ